MAHPVRDSVDSTTVSKSIARGFVRFLRGLEREAGRAVLMPADVGVHQLRRIIKRLRAVLRLCPVECHSGRGLSWDSALRALAHRLAPSRERRVRQSLLVRLVPAGEVQHPWMKRMQFSRGSLRSESRVRNNAARQLSRWISKIASMRPVPPNERLVRRALRDSWSRMEESRRAALRSRSITDLHRWRRRQRRWEIQCHFMGLPADWRRSSVARSFRRVHGEIGRLHDVDQLLEWLTHRAHSGDVHLRPPKPLLRRVKRWRRRLRRRVLGRSHRGLTKQLRRLQRRCLKTRDLSKGYDGPPA